MAFEPTVASRYQKQLLIFGYIRQHKSNQHLVKDLQHLIVKFYDEVVYWTFKEGNDMEQFLNFGNGQEIKGPIFEISTKGIKFQLTLSPNGYSKERPGYVEFYCDCADVPKYEHFIITAYIVFSCKQINYQHKVTRLFKYKQDWAVWAGICMPLQDVKDAKYKSLVLGCYVELLHIHYFEKIIRNSPKNPDISDSVDENNENTEKLKLVSSWTVPIEIHKSFEYEWVINGVLLQRMKDCKIGQHFYSNNFNNNAFCIYCSPKGWMEENKNTFSFQVKLLRLPMEIAELMIDLRMKSNFMDYDDGDIKIMGYEECRSGWINEDEYKYDSKLIDDYDEIRIKCSMEIKQIQVYDVDHDIEQNDWINYGIIE